MRILFINFIMVLFPIMLYLCLGCFNLFGNKNINKQVFIITVFSSILLVNMVDNNHLDILFVNIPIIVCYLKNYKYLGLEVSLLFILCSYFKDGLFIYTLIKYIIFFLVYIILYKKNKFKYKYLISILLVQLIFIYLEYGYYLIDLLIYSLVVISIGYISLYLFSKADDITDMYKVICECEKDKEVKNSLFKLTHEIKNPLAVVNGYLDMLDIDNKEKSIRYINIIKEEIDRSLNIMNEFSMYNKIKIEKEEFDINLLLNNIYDSFKLLVLSKNIDIRYKECKDDIYINGDYNKIEQVLINIIKNSMEAIENDGIINIETKYNKKKLDIIISDNGCGMDEYELENIKNMFYTTKRNGTGLGVTLSNEIISLHGGSIKYDSIKDKGTKCIISLPV